MAARNARSVVQALRVQASSHRSVRGNCTTDDLPERSRATGCSRVERNEGGMEWNGVVEEAPGTAGRFLTIIMGEFCGIELSAVRVAVYEPGYREYHVACRLGSPGGLNNTRCPVAEIASMPASADSSEGELRCEDWSRGFGSPRDIELAVTWARASSNSSFTGVTDGA